MLPGKRLRTLLTVLAASATLAATAPSGVAGKILPDWALAGVYDLDVIPGFDSLASRYAFDFEGQRPLIQFVYDGRGGVFGSTVLTNGSGSISLLQLSGTFTIDDTGVQTVRLAEAAKKPGFEFEGTVDGNTGDLVGTYEQADGFLGFPGQQSGPFTIQRSDPKPRDGDFELLFEPAQNIKGSVRGAPLLPVVTKTQLAVASLTVFGGTELVDGKIRGKIRTRKDGTTSGKLTIKGKNRRLVPPQDGTDRARVKPWKVSLTGPVDESGFHALATIKAFGFRVKDALLTLPVVAGPEEPPPPPPPPPKNFLPGADAEIESGVVVIQHFSVPKRFFGAKATLIVRFPFADGTGTVNAVPATFPGPGVQRQVIANLSGKIYSTQHEPADVALTIKSLAIDAGGVISVQLTGTVVRDNGKEKTVDIDLQAIVRT